MGNDQVEQAKVKQSRTPSAHDKRIVEEVLSGFTATYESDPENRIHTLTLSGSAAVQIHELEVGEGVSEFHSPFVLSDQKDLKSALEWTARQVGIKAVHQLWDELYPREAGSRSAKAEALNAVIAAKEAALQAALARIAELEGAAPPAKLKAVK